MTQNDRQEAKPVLHVCTVASRIKKGLSFLQESCMRNKISIQILGYNMPFLGLAEKLLHVEQFIKTLPDDDLVLFVDAYDVLILSTPDEIIDRFLKFKAPFVISAERFCWPYKDLASKYPPSTSSFKYLNSGSYMGYVGYLKKLFSDISAKATDDDQGLLTLHFLKHPEKFTLDTSCELFLSLFSLTDELVLDIPQKKVKLLETGSFPLILHGNGQSLWHVYIYERFFGQDRKKQKQPEDKNKTILLELSVGPRTEKLLPMLQSISELPYMKSSITIFFLDLKATETSREVIEKWAKEYENQYKLIFFDSKEVAKLPPDVQELAHNGIRLFDFPRSNFDYDFFVNCETHQDARINELTTIVKHVKNV